MSPHNVYFHGEFEKIIAELSPNIPPVLCTLRYQPDKTTIIIRKGLSKQCRNLSHAADPGI